jgi:3-isopropylmalate/(R)-2-methylmalate dehydratase small subunit
MLPIVLPERQVDALFQAVTATPGFRMAVSLQDQVIRLPDGATISFEVDPFRKYRLINGLDDIGLTLQHADKVRAYEAVRRQQEPWAV